MNDDNEDGGGPPNTPPVVLPSITKVEFDHEEARELSYDLLTFLEDEDIDMPTGIAALALTFGRLMAPKRPLPQAEEERFIQNVLNWTGMYFHEGRVQ